MVERTGTTIWRFYSTEDHRWKWHQVKHINVPEALTKDHSEFRAQIDRAALLSGSIGEAAKRVATICLPHFQLEENIIFPAFGVLQEMPLNDLHHDIPEIQRLTDYLSQEHDDPLKQHQEMLNAVDTLLSVATRKQNKEFADLSMNLRNHEQFEEENVYPAVFLIGKSLQQRG